ncbi:hypothetical protein [Methylocystis sp.]|uniref:hypothetical protein n=1 Tax=Methylocystis sp. TaxID=1911079 RepID=UPI003DA29B9B
MAEKTEATFEATTPEAVALDLFRIIRRNVSGLPSGKDELLNLYSECLLAVQDPRNRLEGRHKDLLLRIK